MMTDWVRCFVAVELPPGLVTRIEAVQRDLRGAAGNSVKWVSPAQIHITLKFLGDVEQTRLAAIETGLANAVRDLRPFDISVGGLGAFPTPRRPRVVWVDVEKGKEKLQKLQSVVDHALAALGFAPEQRAFSPHLTLGRVRETASPEPLLKLAQCFSPASTGTLGGTRVSSITFMRSKLTPGGPIYSRLAVLPLLREDTGTQDESPNA